MAQRKRSVISARPGTGVLAAYAANELAPPGRARLLDSLLGAQEQGARVLVVEPIARRSAPWWKEWQTAVERAGGRADEWRFPAASPQLSRRSHAPPGSIPVSSLRARSCYNVQSAALPPAAGGRV